MRYKSKVARLLRQSTNQLDNLERHIRGMRNLSNAQREEILGLIESTKSQVGDAEELVELEDEYHGV